MAGRVFCQEKAESFETGQYIAVRDRYVANPQEDISREATSFTPPS